MKFLLPFVLLAAVSVHGQSLSDKAKKLYEEKKYKELEAMLKAFDDDDDSDYSVAQYYLGRAAFDQKQFDDAADYFAEATESKSGQYAEYYQWLGDTYGTIANDANFFRQGMLAPKMKAAWEKAIELDPKNLPARYSLIQYYTKAPGVMGGSMDKAKEMSKQIGAISPANGHRTMGNIFLQEKKIDAAEKEYLEMVKIDPNFTGALANFYFNQKKYDKAFALYDESLKKNSNDMIAVYQIGKASALSGQRLDMGEECLRKYLAYTPKQNEPSHAGANMRLAQIYEKRGNKPEAHKLFETALKLDGSLKEAKEGLERTSK